LRRAPPGGSRVIPGLTVIWVICFVLLLALALDRLPVSSRSPASMRERETRVKFRHRLAGPGGRARRRRPPPSSNSGRRPRRAGLSRDGRDAPCGARSAGRNSWARRAARWKRRSPRHAPRVADQAARRPRAASNRIHPPSPTPSSRACWPARCPSEASQDTPTENRRVAARRVGRRGSPCWRWPGASVLPAAQDRASTPTSPAQGPASRGAGRTRPAAHGEGAPAEGGHDTGWSPLLGTLGAC